MQYEHPWKYMRKHNMYQERMDLYRDFACDLVNKVYETFLGDDIMGEKEFKEHFEWCWEKVVKEFSEDNIHFEHECELKDYLWDSFYELFYTAEHDMNTLKDNLLIMWNFIFDYGRITKTKTEINYTINAYNKFDKCLNFDYG